MEKELVQKLKQDLAIAVKEKDTEKINLIRQMLNISDEQARYFEIGLTGYPSIDKVWIKNYQENAEKLVEEAPKDRTVWDVIEEKLLEYYNVPAIEYFQGKMSRPEFRELCYTWARTFRAMGVQEDEIVPIYGPLVPNIGAMVYGLNMIGACPYCLKIGLSPASLAEETKEAKIAIVYDKMWPLVAHEFSKDRFKNIMVATITESMPSPKKQIVSFLSKIEGMKSKSRIPDDKKYIWLDKALEIANYYSGEVKVPFKANRRTFITSSSGTTVNGQVKGGVATNETAINQIYMAKVSGAHFFPGDRCLNHFPLSASTSLNVLFNVPLYMGETIIDDPRVSDKDFYNQLIHLKPNQACNTGSSWDIFFDRAEYEISQGKKLDFGYANGWTIGGEGTDVKKLERWNRIMDETGAPFHLYIGYGLTELLSSATASMEGLHPKNKKIIMDVGIPYAGTVISAYDDEGNELPYNKRGNLRVKSNSVMKEYYGKPQLTAETIEDGWIKTGDIGEVDEDGFIYVYGRSQDKLELRDKSVIYLFDIENKIKENSFIDDAVITVMPTELNDNTIVAHIAFDKTTPYEDRRSCIEMINEQLSEYLPHEVELLAYQIYDKIPKSPSSLKKDRPKMSATTTGYFQIKDGKLNTIEFLKNKSGKFGIKYTEIKEDKKVKKKKR